MLTKLLVPLDGSSLAERALPYAAALAHAAEARLMLVRVTRAPQLSPRPESEDDARAYLEAAARKVKPGGLKVERHIHHRYLEDVGHTLSYAVRDRQPDLIVMSTHGRSGLGRWLYGSVADQMLRLVEGPVILVSPACERAWPGGQLRRILVPLDGSDLAEGALGIAAELAGLFGADLLLLRVVELIAWAAGDDPTGYVATDVELLREEAREYLGSVPAMVSGPRTVVALPVELGYAASAIAGVARREDIDLIAMATHGRSGLARFLLGSVAIGTLRQANVPLLVTRPKALSHAARPEGEESGRT